MGFFLMKMGYLVILLGIATSIYKMKNIEWGDNDDSKQ